MNKSTADLRAESFPTYNAARNACQDAYNVFVVNPSPAAWAAYSRAYDAAARFTYEASVTYAE